MMDSTLPENRSMGRALNQPTWHAACYLTIIAWEFVTTILGWWGGWRITRALHGTAAAFDRAEPFPLLGSGCLC
jgi:predicted small integral membrane protein